MPYDKNKYPFNTKDQTPLRRELRNEGTAAEAVLWLLLKGKQLDGMRWRRQFGVGPYILDFYCPQLRLCIELDGAPHDTLHGSLYDCRREEWLQHTHGIRTLRFENKDVFVHQDAVIERIREVTKEILG